MSCPRLPQEISDYIVDLLQNEHEALKQCCLVSKSWVPRARKNLFAMVRFESPADPVAWMRTFPDPDNSPGYLARSLHVACVADFVTAIEENRRWLLPFSNVVQLEIQNDYSTTQPLRLFEIVCSLPLLEDLDIGGLDPGYYLGTSPICPRTSPPLTGTLSLDVSQAMQVTTRALLGLPNGVRFRRFVCTGRAQPDDFGHMMSLVEACSQTLEYIDIKFQPSPFFHSWGDPIDLSEATKLKEVVLRPIPCDINWVTLGLKTITSTHKDLREVSLIIPFHSIPIDKGFDEGVYTQWADLDRALIQFQLTHPIRTKLLYIAGSDTEAGKRASEFIESLLPEAIKGGAIRLVDSGTDLE